MNTFGILLIKHWVIRHQKKKTKNPNQGQDQDLKRNPGNPRSNFIFISFRKLKSLKNL